MKMISGLSNPTSGSIQLFSDKIEKRENSYSKIGSLIETSGFLKICLAMII